MAIKGKKYTFFGLSRTIDQWSRRTGIPSSTIRSRIRQGLPPGQVLKTDYTQHNRPTPAPAQARFGNTNRAKAQSAEAGDTPPIDDGAVNGPPKDQFKMDKAHRCRCHTSGKRKLSEDEVSRAALKIAIKALAQMPMSDGDRLAAIDLAIEMI